MPVTGDAVAVVAADLLRPLLTVDVIRPAIGPELSSTKTFDSLLSAVCFTPESPPPMPEASLAVTRILSHSPCQSLSQQAPRARQQTISRPL